MEGRNHTPSLNEHTVLNRKTAIPISKTEFPQAAPTRMDQDMGEGNGLPWLRGGEMAHLLPPSSETLFPSWMWRPAKMPRLARPNAPGRPCCQGACASPTSSAPPAASPRRPRAVPPHLLRQKRHLARLLRRRPRLPRGFRSSAAQLGLQIGLWAYPLCGGWATGASSLQFLFPVNTFF